MPMLRQITKHYLFYCVLATVLYLITGKARNVVYFLYSVQSTIYVTVFVYT